MDYTVIQQQVTALGVICFGKHHVLESSPCTCTCVVMIISQKVLIHDMSEAFQLQYRATVAGSGVLLDHWTGCD